MVKIGSGTAEILMTLSLWWVVVVGGVGGWWWSKVIFVSNPTFELSWGWVGVVTTGHKLGVFGNNFPQSSWWFLNHTCGAYNLLQLWLVVKNFHFETPPSVHFVWKFFVYLPAIIFKAEPKKSSANFPIAYSIQLGKILSMRNYMSILRIRLLSLEIKQYNQSLQLILAWLWVAPLSLDCI